MKPRNYLKNKKYECVQSNSNNFIREMVEFISSGIKVQYYNKNMGKKKKEVELL